MKESFVERLQQALSEYGKPICFSELSGLDGWKGLSSFASPENKNLFLCAEMSIDAVFIIERMVERNIIKIVPTTLQHHIDNDFDGIHLPLFDPEKQNIADITEAHWWPSAIILSKEHRYYG